MNTRIALGVIMTTLLALPGQVAANQAYQEALAELEVNALEFIQSQDYVTVDPDTLTDDNYYSQENFLIDPNEKVSINLPDADLDPITRAMLFVETKEVSLPHARYRITYSMNTPIDFPEAQHDYVEVTRYNLGPARRNDLLESVPDGQVADLVEFGIGPNVSWRFIMAPVMGIRSGLMYASRKEISDRQAQTADCLGELCLGLVDPLGPDRNWEPIPPPHLTAPVYSEKNNLGVARPTRAIQELWASMSSNGMDPLPYVHEQPPFVFVVSWNTSGQDVAVSALARQFPVMDHEISEMWTQRLEISQVPVEFSRIYVPRARQ